MHISLHLHEGPAARLREANWKGQLETIPSSDMAAGFLGKHPALPHLVIAVLKREADIRQQDDEARVSRMQRRSAPAAAD
jgi:hypothetical protein